MSSNTALSWEMVISKNVHGAPLNFNFCAEMIFKNSQCFPSKSLPVQMNLIGHVFFDRLLM